MHRRQVATWLFAALFLAACSAAGQAQQAPPTPTPLPPNPALERQTYTVARGDIERAIEVTGRVTPVDQTALSFHIDGKLEEVLVARGDTVKEGDLLARLSQDEALEDLRSAQDAVARSQRELETARKTQVRQLKDREQELQRAQQALQELLPGGDNDQLRLAQQEAEKAERALSETRDDQSSAKTDAEYAVRDAAGALVDAQQAWSKANWDNEWVKAHGTDPDNPTKPDPNNPGRNIPNRLSAAEIAAFAIAFDKATSAMQQAERNVEKAKQALERTRSDEIVKIREAEQERDDKQKALDKLLQGQNNKELRAAQDAVESARSALEELRDSTELDDRLAAVEDAQRALDAKQKKVADGRLVAPRAGQVLGVHFAPGDAVQSFEPVIEIADPSALEIAATIGGAQARELSEGQPAELRLLARPDVVLPVVLRRLPGGSTSGGTVEDRDATTRFSVNDTNGLELRITEVGKLRIVLERKDHVLILPPEAIRSFEGRRFVIIRDGDIERRVPVRIGIATDSQVEVLSGVEEGDIIVGQ